MTLIFLTLLLNAPPANAIPVYQPPHPYPEYRWTPEEIAEINEARLNLEHCLRNSLRSYAECYDRLTPYQFQK